MANFLEEQLELIGSFNPDREKKYEIVKSYLPEMIEDNYSRNRALLTFRKYGLGVDKSKFKEWYDEFRYNRYHNPNIIYLPKDQTIPETQMNMTRANLGARYLYVVDYGVEDPITKEIDRRRYGIFTDDQLSKNQVMQRVLDTMAEFDSPPRETIRGMNVNKVWVNPDF